MGDRVHQENFPGGRGASVGGGEEMELWGPRVPERYVCTSIRMGGL